ncbi:tryptophan 2,3-dioxygenase [Microbacterium murale]|uniref:Tryptophan 2,3-dioxygenase n=1 Tax=Microbacterium murale TaxID=1081040 RepID=A0ABU0P5S9_9MICO|nr:tryptophan 2,3-dioxygenase family protein [Microbacterium murale]MDQ0642683.1 tryptophan 2,3-dioxygenase [Microbacterium murale]
MGTDSTDTAGTTDPTGNERPLEDTIVTDLTGRMTYGSYLGLDELLNAQHPVSSPEHHDEMLFIIQHQTTELWLKQLLHELSSARTLLASDDLREALKRVARVKRIQDVMTQQWSVLATLTPTEYAQFRGALGNSSGFQSVQYRAVEFALGNKNERMLQVFRDHPTNLALLKTEFERPTLYDEFLRFASRRGLPIPTEILERDVREPYRPHPSLVPAIREIYENPQTHWDLYEACEDLVDLEDNFQFWRFRHLKTVTRTIGMKPGTGGSSGVGFLQRALELTFFPELYTVRTEIGA